ncbi:MAG: transketolase [Bacteroidetes bacterium]|nr:transketolase [Bacteroidota bacterium]
MATIEQLSATATQIRRDILRMVHACKSGHPGGSLGCADYFSALFFEVMKHQSTPFDMDGKNQDLFFLSNGHISPVYYSALARSGYFDIKELATFRKLNSRLQGHPATHEHLPGIRIASGSLGQGLSVAIGASIAKKLNNDPSTIWCLCGDGEIQEGQIWEALMFASHNKADNLILTVDCNGRQIDGDTKDIMGFGNLRSKFEAFDWKVIEIEGNDMTEVLKGLNSAKELSGQRKPICILMKTEMGQGVDFMMGSHKWHGVAPNDEQLQQALAQLPETLGDY